MKLRRLELQDFRGVRAAAIEFGLGLTVLHGPNELGKSTLVEAIHAALLLQTSSQAGSEHVTWGGSTPACVTLTFEHEGKLWRVVKRFGYRKHALLECSDDVEPPRFREVAAGNGVEGRLRELLAWGIAPPGGRGAPQKAESFLLTALLGRQGAVQEILEASIDGDRDSTGKSLVARAIGALDKDPIVTRIVERLTERVEAVFTPQDRFKTAADSPLVKRQEHLRAQEECLRQLEEDDRKGKSIQTEVARLQDERQRLLGEVESAQATWEAAKAQAERAAVRARLQQEIDDLRRQLDEADRLTATVCELDGELTAGRSNLTAVRDAEDAAAAALDATRRQLQAAAEAVARETEAAEQSGRVREAARAQRRAELETRQTMAEARLKDVTAAEQAVSDVDAVERQFEEASRASRSVAAAVRLAGRTLEHVAVRAQLDILSERQEAVTRATDVLTDAQQREQAARDRLEAAAAAVLEAERARDRRDGELRASEIGEAESELQLLRAVEAHIGISVLRADVQALDETVARARTSRADANGKRTDASSIDRRVAGRILPTREQIAAWRALEQELQGSPVAASARGGRGGSSDPPASSAPPAPPVPSSPWLPVAAGLAAGLLVGAAAYVALASPLATAVFAGLVVAAIVGALVRVDRQSRSRAQVVDYERYARRHDRWTQEVEPSLGAAGLANLAAFEDAVAEIEGLTAEAQRLRREADGHDLAAAEAERAAAPLESRRAMLTRLESEAPAADAVAVAERLATFGNDADAVRLRIVDAARDLEAMRERLREAVAAGVRAAQEQRDARQSELDAATRAVAVAETTLTHARQQSDPEAITRLRARLAEIGEVAPLPASAAEASAALEEAKRQQTMAATQADGLRGRLDELRPEIERRVSALGGNLADARQQVEREIEAIAIALTALVPGAAGDTEAATAALERWTDEHQRLTQHCGNEQATLEAATALRKGAEGSLRDLETAVAARRGQLTAVDRTALESRLRHATGDPAFQVLDDARLDPVVVRATLDGLRQRLEQCTNDLNHAKGQLHLIAGHVGSERLEQQDEATRYARADALESELTEKAALRLLREIQKVEAERTTHLGRALAGPITERFRTLTGGRYGPIALAPDLKVQHIEAAGAPRTLALLSVGTREQLATLLRLAIAGHLQTAVVLDDQLVHSDSGRLAWFRDRLRASAREHDHQIIVFTCRPGDYVREDAGEDGVTVVDLTAVVSR